MKLLFGFQFCVDGAGFQYNGFSGQSFHFASDSRKILDFGTWFCNEIFLLNLFHVSIWKSVLKQCFFDIVRFRFFSKNVFLTTLLAFGMSDDTPMYTKLYEIHERHDLSWWLHSYALIFSTESCICRNWTCIFRWTPEFEKDLRGLIIIVNGEISFSSNLLVFNCRSSYRDLHGWPAEVMAMVCCCQNSTECLKHEVKEVSKDSVLDHCHQPVKRTWTWSYFRKIGQFNRIM